MFKFMCSEIWSGIPDVLRTFWRGCKIFALVTFFIILVLAVLSIIPAIFCIIFGGVESALAGVAVELLIAIIYSFGQTK